MSLNATQGQLSAAEDSTRSAGMDEEEKQRLVQLVRLQVRTALIPLFPSRKAGAECFALCVCVLQEREINALKAEINLLRMKGGHVYTPSPAEPTQPAEFAPASIEAGGDSY